MCVFICYERFSLADILPGIASSHCRVRLLFALFMQAHHVWYSSAMPSTGSGNASTAVDGYMSFILFSVAGLACKFVSFVFVAHGLKLRQSFASLARLRICSCVCLLESSWMRLPIMSIGTVMECGIPYPGRPWTMF